ncbi:MAG: DMT family transporter [Saprospiraceae bacterium]
MWILVGCIILNALIGVIFKLFDRYGINNFQAIIVNYFTCVLTAAVVLGANPIPTNFTTLPWFYFALGLGVVFIIVFNLMAATVQKFGIVIATIFQKMSLIAPALIAILYYDEVASWAKWFGIILSILAIVLLSYQKMDIEFSKTNNKIFWWFPFLTFLGSCVIDSALFQVEKLKLASNGDIGFISTLFMFAGITGTIFLMIKMLYGNVTFQWKNVLAGIGLGIPNFFSIYLLLLALQQGWGGSVVFPVNNVGVLIMASIFGMLLFSEKLTLFKKIGFVLAIFAIVLITIF